MILEKNIEEKNELLGLLANFEKLGRDYIFRGHEKASYRLQPSGFREENTKKLWEQYPHTKEKIQNEWFVEPEALQKVRILFNAEGLNEQNYNLAYHLTAHGRIRIETIFWHFIELMVYNYSVCKYGLKYKSYLYEYNLKNMRSTDPNYWASKETFIFLLQYIMPIQQLDSLDGRILKSSEVPEGRTGSHEPFLQHYESGTSVLDWTYDPYIALFFSTWKLFDNQNITNNLPEEPFSLFKYQQIDTSEFAPVQIMSVDDFVKNEREKRQKGTFLSFINANKFYLLHERHPSLEDYCDQEIFKVEKYNIKMTLPMLSFIKEILDERKLNKSFLLPEA